MKRSKLIIAIAIYFLLILTESIWDSKLGGWAFLSFLFLAIYFFVLFIILLVQIFYSLKEKLRDKQRLLLIAVMAIVLLQSVYYPRLIDFKTLGKDTVLTANIEGVANCTTTLVLFDDNSFSRRVQCFKTTEVEGNYYIIGDTIFFKDVILGRDVEKFYKYAVITNYNTGHKDFKGNLELFENYSDSLGYPLGIVENKLFK